LKILHVITGLASGGAETQLRMLVRHSRHDADVVALYNAGAVADGLREDGVPVVELGMRSNRELGALLRLGRLIRAGRYDVVHTHLYRACVYGRVAARLAGVPRIVATEHSAIDGQIEGRASTRAVRTLYRASERLGDATIAVSAGVRAELLAWGIPPARVTTIPNGLAFDLLTFSAERRRRTRAALGISPGIEVIGTVGRLHAGKSYDLLLDAAAPLLGTARRLLIVGDGPELGRLRAMAENLGIGAWVHFAGEQAAAGMLAAMDVFASPSPRETFGLAALEAMANGLPVVYRASPALDELPSVPRSAVRVGTVTEMREALLMQLAGTSPSAGSTERRCPAELARYDITRTAREVDDLYELPGQRWRTAPAYSGGRS
jgi:glycosyltransferase involved in cell wall biosynthesis